MAEVDVLRAQVVRLHTNQPWGFRLEGGIDSGKPLTILRVTPASPADKIGLRSGDAVVEIGDTPTDNLTHQQAVDLVSSHGDTLLLTLERRARGSVPTNPVLAQVGADGSAPLKHYQTFDMSGGSGGRKFHIVQSQPFHATKPQQVGPSVPGGPRLISQPPPGQYQSQQAQYQQQTFYQSQPQYQPQPVQYQQQPQYQPQQVQYQASHDPYQPSQSRTFRNIQGIMEYSDGPVMLARVKGAPPGTGNTLVNNQYNSPIALYSSDNLADTLESQVKAMSLNQSKVQEQEKKTMQITPETLLLVQEMDQEKYNQTPKQGKVNKNFSERQNLAKPQTTSLNVNVCGPQPNVTRNSTNADANAKNFPKPYSSPLVHQEQDPETNGSDVVKTFRSSLTIKPQQVETPVLTTGMPYSIAHETGSDNSPDQANPQEGSLCHSVPNSSIGPSAGSGHKPTDSAVCDGRKEETDKDLESGFEYHAPVTGSVKPYLQEDYSSSRMGDEASTDSGIESIDDNGPAIKSRSFKRLQEMLKQSEEKSGPAAGTAGLPPQRSLYQERLKEEEAARRAGSPRVRVLMPQQYNTPMGLYSASNVMDTFQSQTSALLDEIDKRDSERAELNMLTQKPTMTTELQQP